MTLSLNWELTVLAKLAGQWAHGIHSSPFLNAQRFAWVLVPGTQALLEPSPLLCFTVFYGSCFWYLVKFFFFFALLKVTRGLPSLSFIFKI